MLGVLEKLKIKEVSAAEHSVKRAESRTNAFDLTNEDTVRYLRLVKEAVTRKKVFQTQRNFLKDEAYRMEVSTEV